MCAFFCLEEYVWRSGSVVALQHVRLWSLKELLARWWVARLLVARGCFSFAGLWVWGWQLVPNWQTGVLYCTFELLNMMYDVQ